MIEQAALMKSREESRDLLAPSLNSFVDSATMASTRGTPTNREHFHNPLAWHPGALQNAALMRYTIDITCLLCRLVYASAQGRIVRGSSSVFRCRAFSTVLPQRLCLPMHQRPSTIHRNRWHPHIAIDRYKATDSGPVNRVIGPVTLGKRSAGQPSGPSQRLALSRRPRR
jgi:hypothetical protein